MSAAMKPDPREPGVSLALRDAAVGDLPVDVRQQLELRKLSNQIAGELAKINWGAKLDLSTRRAIADWGQQFRVDPTIEINVLGGNIYLNAAFYLRHLSELIAAGLVEYAYADHIEDDPRLVKLGPEGEGEQTRRLRERIKHQVPDKAASAVVFRVKLRAMDREVTGTKWCGGVTRKNDPVGDEKPVETSESRAARRAMRLLASHVPPAKAEEIQAIEQSAEILSARVDDAKRRIAAQEAAYTKPRVLMPGMKADAPYETDATAPAQSPREVPSETPPPVTDGQRATAAHAAQMADPFADEAPDDAEQDLPFDAPAAPARELFACEAYVIPAGLGPRSGVRLAELSTDDLTALWKWASKPSALKNYPDLAHHCESLLDARRLGEAEEPAK